MNFEREINLAQIWVKKFLALLDKYIENDFKNIRINSRKFGLFRLFPDGFADKLGDSPKTTEISRINPEMTE